jgi:MarR family 2-MHQ and catechol resistance regulon transcriptional repressor
MNQSEQTQPTEEQSMKLFIALTKCYHALSDAVRKHISTYGINATEYGVLQLLHFTGPLPLGEVAAKQMLTSGSMTYVIDSLEGHGYVQRVACPKDRRRLYAALTDSGTLLVERILPEHATEIGRIAAALSPEEQKLAENLLTRLAEIHNQEGQPEHSICPLIANDERKSGQ